MSKFMMNSEHEIPLRHEFMCTGFIERVASWVRFLCLFFLFLQLLATAANLIYPFAIDPPLFYNQLLFFLLSCAAFEIFAIPIDAIKDHCIIDLQKTMVVKVYNRYFFTRVEVLATFDKVKAIGVSARPEPMWKGYFSESPNRFAIMMLTEKGRLHRLSDYNLGLDESNNLIKSLHESYLRNTEILPGSENVELCLDRHMNNSFIQRPCQRSALTLIDAALIPLFQVGLGCALVAILIALTSMVGSFVSEQLFSTSLKVAHQPIFQLVLAPARPEPETQLLTPPEGPPPASPLTEGKTVSAGSAGETGIAVEDSGAAVTQQPTSTTVPDDIEVAALPVGTQYAQIDQQIADNQSQTSTVDNAFPLTLPPADTIKTEPDAITEPVAPHNKPPIIDSPMIKPAARIEEVATERVASKPEKNRVEKTDRTDAPKAVVPILIPLPSRIPTFDENSILLPAVAANEIAQPVRITLPPQIAYKADDKQKVATIQARPQSRAPVAGSAARPAETDAKPENATTKIADLAQPPVKLAVVTTTTTQKPAISVASYVGQNVNFVMNSLGKPLTVIKSTSGQQLIYSGITLLTDSLNETVVQVNLTSRQSKTLGTLATNEGLMVGSLVREAKARLGIPQQKANSAGLHFPARGISVYPLPGDSQTIGSIQVYQARAQAGH